jgi:hypothetical protein
MRREELVQPILRQRRKRPALLLQRLDLRDVASTLALKVDDLRLEGLVLLSQFNVRGIGLASASNQGKKSHR